MKYSHSKPKRSRNLLRQVLIIVVAGTGLAILVYIAFIIFLFSSGFGMPAQDCMGNTFDVKGYVTDSQNNPIANASIRVWDEGKYELRALTDERGYFRTESIFSFGCYAFQVEISVDGFESKILSYFPPSEGFTSELPDEITIQLEQMRK